MKKLGGFSKSTYDLANELNILVNEILLILDNISNHTLILTKLRHFLCYKIRFYCQQALLSVEQEIVIKVFLERFGLGIYKTLINCDDSEEIEIRHPFYRSFKTFWNSFGGLWTLINYLWIRGDLK